MYHSITIGDKNTWDDWHLIAKARPFFEPPTPKTRYVDIPGSSGSLDLSETLTGYPVFNDREGSFEFMVLNLEDVDSDYDYKYAEWDALYTDIMQSLSGKKLKAVLDDDKEHYYEGKFWVSNYKPGTSAQDPRATITISYKVEPYKWEHNSTTDPWLWDSFRFDNGMILPALFKDIVLRPRESISINIPEHHSGYAAVRPEIIVVDNPVEVRFINRQLHIDETKILLPGTNSPFEFVIWGDDIEFILTNKDLVNVTTASIRFRIGGL